MAKAGRAFMRREGAWVLWGMLFVLGIGLTGQGLWIHAKAVAAQWLLQSAWERTLLTHHPAKPWPWADTWPVGRLIVPRLGIDQVILADASGRSLAFGPGQVENGKFPDETRRLILSGHRDTHFSFLPDLQTRDEILLQTVLGHWVAYAVEGTKILDSRTDTLVSHSGGNHLFLITCYPFDALLPGGPLRFVVMATQQV